MQAVAERRGCVAPAGCGPFGGDAACSYGRCGRAVETRARGVRPRRARAPRRRRASRVRLAGPRAAGARRQARPRRSASTSRSRGSGFRHQRPDQGSCRRRDLLDGALEAASLLARRHAEAAELAHELERASRISSSSRRLEVEEVPDVPPHGVVGDVLVRPRGRADGSARSMNQGDTVAFAVEHHRAGAAGPITSPAWARGASQRNHVHLGPSRLVQVAAGTGRGPRRPHPQRVRRRASTFAPAVRQRPS